MLKSKIKAISKDKGLSLTDLGKEIGVSKTSMFKYEKEPDVIQIGVLKKMSRRLNVSFSELIEGINEPFGENPEGSQPEKLEVKRTIADDYLNIIKNMGEGISALSKGQGGETSSLGSAVKELSSMLQSSMNDRSLMGDLLEKQFGLINKYKELGKLQNRIISFYAPSLA